MPTTPVYESALGISVGDLVRTSYGTGPNEVERIHGPYYFNVGVFDNLIVRTWPVISIGFSGDSGINNIRQEGDRWFTDGNDEIFVTKNKAHKPAQLAMFGPSAGQNRQSPYLFKPGVDYTHNVWKCRHCGDFNAPPNDERLRRRWHCPICGKQHVVDRKIILMTPRVVGKSQMNEYTTALDGLSFREQSEIEAIGEKYISNAAQIWFAQRREMLANQEV